MAKKQQVMGPMMGQQQQRSRQPRGGSMEAMLIQGESGLSETISNNFQLVSNPMMQAIGGIMAKDAARGNALQKNLAKGNNVIDTETGELLKDISDRKVRDQIMNYSRGLKSIFAQSGGTNMDLINGEIGDLERAVEEWNKDKTNFGKNLNGPQNSQGGATEPHYSAGTSTTTLGYNARVYGDDYESVRYNPKTKELEWTLTNDEITFDHLETEEDRRKGRNLQGFVDRGRELTPEQQADYDRLLPQGKKGSVIVTQSMLDEGVVLKDAGVTTAIQDNVTALVDMGTTGKAVTRDDNGNVLVPGFDLNKMTNDKSTLITMAWDNHLHISGGKTFVEHWAESHPDDKMEWARQGANFDHKKLKEEVTNYYQMKFNKQYENGQANYKDNTQAGRLSTSIDNMVDNAFSPNVDATSGEGGAEQTVAPGSVIGPEGGKQMRFDVSSIVGEGGNMKMEVNEDGDFSIMVYNNSTKEYEVKEVIDKSSDIERFKRKVKIYFGSTTAF